MEYNYRGKTAVDYFSTTKEITLFYNDGSKEKVEYDDTLFFALWNAKKEARRKREDETLRTINKSTYQCSWFLSGLIASALMNMSNNSNERKERQYIMCPIKKC